MSLPREPAEQPWDDLDFLGWRDPGAPDRAYLVTGSERPVGIVLRVAPGARRNLLRSSLCGLCLTGHSGGGVDLLAAPLAGPPGRAGNTVALYMCADLACSLYVRGKKTSPLVKRLEESLTLDERIARTLRNLDGFLAKVMGETAAR